MIDLFGDLWVHKNGPVLDERENKPARTFHLWCAKLSNLSDEEFTRGIESVERKSGEAIAQDLKFYPPSYAQFIGLTKPKTKNHEAQCHRPYSQLLPKSTLDDRKAWARDGVKSMREIMRGAKDL